MLVSDIIARVRRTIGDTNSVEVTDADIIRWINDGMREIVIASELLQTKSFTAPLANVSHYQLPTDILKTHSLKYKGVSLDFVSLEQAEKLFPNKDDASSYPSGTPTHYWIWGGELYLYPAPDFTGTNEIVLYYNRTPAEVAVSGDTPEIPSAYHNRLVEYCMAQAYELDENMASSSAKMQQFQGNLQNMRSLSEWENQDFYPFITDLQDSSIGYYPNG